jgi:dTDP-4-dehydrorhamnose reductase
VPEAGSLLTSNNTFFNIDVRIEKTMRAVIERFEPSCIINAAGIVKQRQDGQAAIPCIEVNALFPHRLQQVAASYGVRVIHISTDCVFSGQKGNYTENDVADAEDIYGRSKLIGEIINDNALTLRTSMIGWELKHKHSLLEWFLKQKGRVPGYSRAIFSGFTTLELARIINLIIANYPDANGLYHVSSRPISKYDLLCMINDALDLGVRVIPDETVVIDRSLDSTKFQRTFDYCPPMWEAMVAELALRSRKLANNPYKIRLLRGSSQHV